MPAPGGTYQFTTGTSVAAAFVSGIAALLIELNPRLKAPEIKKILLATAMDLGPKGRDDQFGAGLADAYRAAQAVTASALEAAGKHGIVLVAAAGNAGPKSASLYPAADPNVIA